MRRVVMTGTRDTREALAMKRDLCRALDKCLAAFGPFVVADGQCRVRGVVSGVDALAWQWAVQHKHAGVVHEPWPIDKAGHRRMLAPGADLVLAIPHRAGESRGTRDCMRAAEQLGVPVVEWPFDGLNDFLLSLGGRNTTGDDR